MPSTICSYVAFVCPACKTMPLLMAFKANSLMCFNSGATVMFMILPSEASQSSSIKSISTGLNDSGVCTPNLSGDINGPSRCIPNMRAPFSLPIASTTALIPLINSAFGAEYSVGMKEVTP